jgi:hypothetical protein
MASGTPTITAKTAKMAATMIGASHELGLVAVAVGVSAKELIPDVLVAVEDY